MPKILDRDPIRESHIIQYEDHLHAGHTRDTITVRETSIKSYKLGEILGKVTATGKYKQLDPAATDGSENFAGIFIGTDDAYDPDNLTVPANTDTSAVVVYRGQAAVGKAYLRFIAGTTDVQKEAVYAQMKAAGFKLIYQPTGLA
jgi:hypothetical protein